LFQTQSILFCFSKYNESETGFISVIRSKRRKIPAPVAHLMTERSSFLKVVRKYFKRWESHDRVTPNRQQYLNSALRNEYIATQKGFHGRRQKCSASLFSARADDVIKCTTYYNTRSPDSSVGMTTGYELDDRNSIAGRGKRLLFTPQNPDRICDTPILLTNTYLGLFSRGGGVRQGHEADHAPPTRAEIKDGAVVTLLPHMTSWRDP
jgi:hypothetical protein